MHENHCLLCGRTADTGLNILGCTICFPGEKKLVSSRCMPYRRRKLARLYREKC